MLKIGADPELFLYNNKTLNFVSAHNKFPGTKQDPYKVGNGAIQVDGTAIEFNIRPALSLEEFISNIEEMQGIIKNWAYKNHRLSVSHNPVAIFEKDYFDSLSVKERTLGCDPEYSALTGRLCRKPDLIGETFRTTGGHVHVGYSNKALQKSDFENQRQIAVTLSKNLLEVAEQWENDMSSYRRLYYGSDFAFRPKPYGVEIRCLDSLWTSKKEYITEIYNCVKRTMENM